MKTCTLNFLIILFISILWGCETGPAKPGASEQKTPMEQSTPAPEPSKAVNPPAADEHQPADTTDKISSTGPVYGIDLSKFQGDEIEYLDAKKDHLSFVICKATEGITYTDPDFKNNWQTIPQKGFIRGAYHFYRSADDPKAQAEHFAQTIKDLQAHDLPPVVDFEGGGIDKSQAVATVQADLLTFLKILKQQTDRTPIIYTDIPVGDKYLNQPKFSEYPLWIALYENTEQPRLPLAWKKKGWVFWQKSSKHQIDSQSNDFDLFNGQHPDLIRFIEKH